MKLTREYLLSKGLTAKDGILYRDGMATSKGGHLRIDNKRISRAKVISILKGQNA